MKIINTANDLIIFTDNNGDEIQVPKNKAFAYIDTENGLVSFHLQGRYWKDGKALLSGKAEDIEIDGSTYTIDELAEGKGLEGLTTGGVGFSAEIVAELPEEGKDGVIYLVGPDENGTYTEYLWLKDLRKFEMIGNTDVKLDNYYTKTETDDKFTKNEDLVIVKGGGLSSGIQVTSGTKNKAESEGSMAFGTHNEIKSGSRYSVAMGSSNTIDTTSSCNLVAGQQNRMQNRAAFSQAFGLNNKTNNQAEFACGQYNDSSYILDGTKTIFSVGNGESNANRKNAFEVKLNGDIYFYDKDGQKVKLQDSIGAGGVKLQPIDEIIEEITGGVMPEYGEYMEFAMTPEQYQELKQIAEDENTIPTYYGDMYGKGLDGNHFALFNYVYYFDVFGDDLKLSVTASFLNPDELNNQNKVISTALNDQNNRLNAIEAQIGEINEILTRING